MEKLLPDQEKAMEWERALLVDMVRKVLVILTVI